MMGRIRFGVYHRVRKPPYHRYNGKYGKQKHASMPLFGVLGHSGENAGSVKA